MVEEIRYGSSGLCVFMATGCCQLISDASVIQRTWMYIFRVIYLNYMHEHFVCEWISVVLRLLFIPGSRLIRLVCFKDVSPENKGTFPDAV